MGFAQKPKTCQAMWTKIAFAASACFNVIFGIIFVVQLVLFINEAMNPTKLVTVIQNAPLKDVPFPLTTRFANILVYIICNRKLLFRICVRPGLDEEKIKKAGYTSFFSYVVGFTNKSDIIGWGGLGPEESDTGNPGIEMVCIFFLLQSKHKY